MPWEDLVLVFGPVSIAWGPAVSLIISFLKRYAGLTKTGIDVAVWILGFGGMTVAKVMAGATWWEAIGSALMAVLSAKGFYEVVSKPVGRVLGKS